MADPSKTRWFSCLVVMIILAAAAASSACPTSGNGSACNCGTACTCCQGHSATPAEGSQTLASASFGPDVTSVDILMQNYLFSPASITIYVGTTVTWTNLDNDLHNTVSDYGLWESDLIAQGQTYSFTFENGMDGEWHYLCTLHGGMEGTITVLVPEPISAGMIVVGLLCVGRRNRPQPRR